MAFESERINREIHQFPNQNIQQIDESKEEYSNIDTNHILAQNAEIDLSVEYFIKELPQGYVGFDKRTSSQGDKRQSQNTTRTRN